MARLSEEHHRTTASMTAPKSARTSGRLRDIFKPRRSEGSTSSKTLTNSPSAAAKAEHVPPSHGECSHAPTEELAVEANSNLKPANDSGGFVPGMDDVAFTGFGGFHEVVVEQPSPLGANTEVESVDALSVSTPVQGDLLAESDAHSRQKSFASNIFDDQDSLSAGIREYVVSKIAEAFHQHSCDCSVRAPLKFTAQFELGSVGETSQGFFFKRILANANILHGPKRIGSFALGCSPNTYNLQRGIIGLYILTIIFSAFIGPKTLFTTIWRISIALIIYFFAGRMLGWQKVAQPDMLLAPVIYAAGLLHDIFCDNID